MQIIVSNLWSSPSQNTSTRHGSHDCQHLFFGIPPQISDFDHLRSVRDWEIPPWQGKRGQQAMILKPELSVKAKEGFGEPARPPTSTICSIPAGNFGIGGVRSKLLFLMSYLLISQSAIWSSNILRTEGCGLKQTLCLKRWLDLAP